MSVSALHFDLSSSVLAGSCLCLALNGSEFHLRFLLLSFRDTAARNQATWFLHPALPAEWMLMPFESYRAKRHSL